MSKNKSTQPAIRLETVCMCFPVCVVKNIIINNNKTIISYLNFFFVFNFGRVVCIIKKEVSGSEGFSVVVQFYLFFMCVNLICYVNHTSR